MENFEKFSSEEFDSDSEQTPEEFIESLRETEAGKEIMRRSKDDSEVPKEERVRTNADMEAEMSGEKHKVCWEGMTGNRGCSEYMPEGKAKRWMGMLEEAYPGPFYRHWLEPENKTADEKED